MRILVTGATGFVGKHLVRKLSEANHRVTIGLQLNEKNPFDSKIQGHVFSFDNINKDINFLKKQKIEGIVHLASLYLTDHTSDQVSQLIDSNVRFGTHILEASAQAGVKWFINTGTFWQNYQNKEYSPVNLYAATKQAFESIAQYYIETDQIKFCTLKLADTFGPGDNRPKIFNLWDKIVKTGETLDMSPGDQIIDISYIDDIINCFTLLIMHFKNNNTAISNGEVFTVNADRRYSLKELAMIFEESTGRPLHINWGGKSYREREVMIPWENGKRVPGWKPNITLEDGIKKTYKRED